MDNNFCNKYENSIFYSLDENLILFGHDDLYIEGMSKIPQFFKQQD